METKTFSASIEALHDMLQWIRTEAKKAGFHSSDLYQIELASEEAIVNVIHYSYGDRGGHVEISIDVLPQQFQVVLVDAGRPFNPLAKMPKNKETDLLDRKIGGLGLLFIRKCLDEVSYQRKDKHNVLTLIKKRH